MTDMPDAPQPPPPVDPPRAFESGGSGTFGGRPVAYRCVAEEIHLPGKDGKPRAGVFSFSYLETEGGRERPVMFVFNGGPGSASLWLHMGALGPRRVALPGDASAPAQACPVLENEHCPLDVADLVFVDPPGTGFSRALGATKPEELWGLDVDAEVVGAFVRAWLTRHKRWSSPRFLCGESYGTTRAVSVAGKLAEGFAGFGFDGLALISVVLDFHTVRFQAGNPIADASSLPTYAATALHHGRVQAPQGAAAFLDEARRFAADEYLPALFNGARLDAGRQEAVTRTLSTLTGLSEAWLRRARLRIEPERFRKELLRERGLVVGRLDSRYTGRDRDDAGEAPEADPSSQAMDDPFVSAMNSHLTEALGIGWDRPYVAFSMAAMQAWAWAPPRKEGDFGWPGYVNVAPTLGRLLRTQPRLRVLMANGLYDLATPFYAVEGAVAGFGADAGRIAMRYYEAGHMMYLHEPSLAALAVDIRALVSG